MNVDKQEFKIFLRIYNVYTNKRDYTLEEH